MPRRWHVGITSVKRQCGVWGAVMGARDVTGNVLRIHENLIFRREVDWVTVGDMRLDECSDGPQIVDKDAGRRL